MSKAVHSSSPDIAGSEGTGQFVSGLGFGGFGGAGRLRGRGGTLGRVGGSEGCDGIGAPLHSSELDVPRCVIAMQLKTIVSRWAIAACGSLNDMPTCGNIFLTHAIAHVPSPGHKSMTPG